VFVLLSVKSVTVKDQMLVPDLVMCHRVPTENVYVGITPSKPCRKKLINFTCVFDSKIS